MHLGWHLCWPVFYEDFFMRLQLVTVQGLPTIAKEPMVNKNNKTTR